jgi:UDP-N-acetylglucosamine--N-acetylmuramyl-(pentapeptide) pyrophosphoryl-undecaprenol N-acetylglucosamine transferase
MFFSSPIGLGHITRDIAIMDKLIQMYHHDGFSFVTGSRAYDYLLKLRCTAPYDNLSIYNLYNPPKFSVVDGKLQHSFTWMLKYVLYYKNSKRALDRCFGSMDSCDMYKIDNNCNNRDKKENSMEQSDDDRRIVSDVGVGDTIISDEDFASLSFAKDSSKRRIFITDILETKFSRSSSTSIFSFPFLSYIFPKIESALNASMSRLIESSQCIIIPEPGDDHDNFYYTGPIVREIFFEKEELKKRLFIKDKKTILVTTGGTDGCRCLSSQKSLGIICILKGTQ